ncbi:probable LRR receptor-like serine/threonine-protein kinase, partial [Tanacetum coccineum]
RIPNFIGNWTQLKTLRFEGNYFEGLIPPSFSRLTALQELRITGLRNGTLNFITNWKSLTVVSTKNVMGWKDGSGVVIGLGQR